MESLNYAVDGRALLFTDDTDFSVDGALKIKHMLKKWDVEDAVGHMGFMDPLLPNAVKMPSLSDRFLGSSGDDADDHLGKSSPLNSVMEFGARKESNGNPSFIDNSVLSPPESSVSAKRSRITHVQSPVPTCQVYGCNKDLSSSKDYHKRHKVCDVHSKTPVVIVNGIHQRFCQQCSRFQKLPEFDEGKRSCRKRLAGHNERRRKPQLDTHLSSTYFSTDASKTSLIFSRILAGSFLGLQYNEPSNLKLEEDVLPKSVLRFHGMGKQYPSKSCPLSSVDQFCVSSDSGSVRSLLSARSGNTQGISVHNANNVCTLATPLGEICTSENLSSFIPEIPQQVNGLKLEGRNTVNLVELSLHLQRVEQQKYYGGQIKLENGIFCDSTMSIPSGH